MTEHSKPKKSESGPKLLTLETEIAKASKNLGSGVKVVFTKTTKPVIPVN